MPARPTRFYNPPRYLLRKMLILRLLRGESLRGKDSLEIGYGGGDLLLTCARLGLGVHGYDFSELARQEASARIAQSGVAGIQLFTAPEAAYGREYDYLLACEVLEHIHDDGAALRRWHAALRPGGRLILSVPAHAGHWNHNDVYAGHLRRYEREDLRALLVACGYRPLRLWSYPFPACLLLDLLLDRAARRLLRRARAADQAARTRASGVARQEGALLRRLSNPFVLAPAHWLQQLFLERDLASGYLVLAARDVDPE